jgi:hypothetical protein
MSEYSLTIAKSYEKRRWGRCVAHLDSLGHANNAFVREFEIDDGLWPMQREEVAGISLLNLATVGLLTDFVSELLGRSGNDLMEDELFGNLPWWLDCIWIPVDFSPPRAFEDDPDGPFFFGSAPRLMTALGTIQSKSTLPLGPVLPAYKTMRDDLRAFYRSPFEGLRDDNEGIQWVWRGLFDAATIAQQDCLPILGNGL